MMWCEIRFAGGRTRRVEVPRSTFKLERENAWAMTQGYVSRGGQYYLCMYTASENANVLKSDFVTPRAYVPKILSYRRTKEPNYPVSLVGRHMGVSDYSRLFGLSHKYAAIVDRLIRIDGHLRRVQGRDLWDSVCSAPGLFDIWEPEAPRNRMLGRFDEGHGGVHQAQHPMILIVRGYDLDQVVHVETRQSRTDAVEDSGVCRLSSPTMPYSRQGAQGSGFAGALVFDEAVALLKDAIRDYTAYSPTVKEVLINDTSLIEAS